MIQLHYSYCNWLFGFHCNPIERPTIAETSNVLYTASRDIAETSNVLYTSSRDIIPSPRGIGSTHSFLSSSSSAFCISARVYNLFPAGATCANLTISYSTGATLPGFLIIRSRLPPGAHSSTILNKIIFTLRSIISIRIENGFKTH